MTALLVIGGIALLIIGGDALVRGAIALSLNLGLSAALVGMTVVALGTSAPEIVISIDAALSGAPDIALGNVVGSNIANSLLIVGVPASIVALNANSSELRRSYGLMLAATALFSAFALTGQIGRLAGAALLAGLAGTLVHAYRTAVGRGGEAVGAVKPANAWKIAGLLLVGVVALPTGADFLVEGSRDLARRFGLSEAAIGLTIVAVGTSLPELATSAAAAWRGRSDVALGNVIGSNMLNLLLVIGVTASISPLPVSRVFQTIDIPVMILTTLLLAPFLFRRMKIGRRSGLFFLVLYALFVALTLGP